MRQTHREELYNRLIISLILMQEILESQNMLQHGTFTFLSQVGHAMTQFDTTLKFCLANGFLSYLVTCMSGYSVTHLSSLTSSGSLAVVWRSLPPGHRCKILPWKIHSQWVCTERLKFPHHTGQWLASN